MTQEEFYTYQPRTRLQIYPNKHEEICIKQRNEYDEPIVIITKDQALWLIRKLNFLVNAMEGKDLPGSPTGEWGAEEVS